MSFYTSAYTGHMQHPQDPNLEQPRFRWSWFTLSCVSLFSGFLYLAVVDITAPVQLTQNQTEQQP
ncbi:hypothetical protein DXZ20_22505 [Leptolyngbyaceae cyanobacterium CCMR0081]|uniref:Uncharacterized protein n=1 Tax=Adonisia turfae CCMR0081 TaxID=2292702 RepID=A0A6M0RQ39_9CYAN|nr:hypothetical protein [Adonisia turfae CCMR0081]